MKHKFNEEINRLMNNPVIFIFGTVTVLTTLWGLIAIFKDIKEFAGTQIASVVIISLVLIFILPVFTVFFIKLWNWSFFIPLQENDRYLYTEIKRKWMIDRTGDAKIEQEKTYLFVKPPEEEDLADIVFSSEPLELEDLNQDPLLDAHFSDHLEIAKGIHKVFWKPKTGQIKIAKPYKHTTKVSLPISDIPEYKCMTIPFNVYAIKFQLDTESMIPFEKLVIFKGSRFFRFKKVDKIARRGRNIRQTKAPLPIITNNNKNFSWNVQDIKPGTTFFVVMYFKKLV